MALVYIIDDEENMCKALKFYLENNNEFEVNYFTNPLLAIETLNNIILNKSKLEYPDVIVTDLKMAEMDGISFLSNVKKIDNNIPIIIMTAYATVKNAVLAMKEGAFDYIIKPFEPEELKLIIKKAIEHTKLLQENDMFKSSLDEVEFIGESPAIKNILNMVKEVAKSKTTVLILGESGTGKELIAKLIHKNSDRANKAFVKINCAAIPDTLLESELFGHKKGAFTGALTDKIGKFELANGGTIFLDEIGDMNINLQSKLLRVLQEKQFEKIGCNKLIEVDVRIIAATNQDLLKMIENKTFREDLYFRLNVFPIKLPPLRERKEDIILLVNHFIKKFNREFKKNVLGIDDDVKALLLNYSYPGNVRELSNIIERAMILAKSNVLTINLFDINSLKSNMNESEVNDVSSNLSLKQIEKQHIIDILNSTGGHKGKAAEILKIDRSTLYRLMKKYNINL